MSEITKKVSDYYTSKVKQFGADSKGVDWNSKESQYLRFEKLAKILDVDQHFSVLDFGCGTGEFVKFLNQKKLSFNYFGFDISDEMIRVSREIHFGSNIKFSNQISDSSFDYVIGSGIFNVKMGFSDNQWHQYILETLDRFNRFSLKGFSFNVLTIYSDLEKRRPDLHYADPLYLFDYCKKNYSRFVTLVHDYPLYEFTIHVKK
jgi:SAM-dependent methyltransferase